MRTIKVTTPKNENNRFEAEIYSNRCSEKIMKNELSWEEHEKIYGKTIEKVPDICYDVYNSYEEAWQGKHSYESNEENHLTLRVVKCLADGKYYTLFNY